MLISFATTLPQKYLKTVAELCRFNYVLTEKSRITILVFRGTEMVNVELCKYCLISP